MPLFDIEIDALRRDETIDLLLNWMREPTGTARYVVTPNVNHVVKLQKHTAFREAYRHASLVIADGNPIIWASRLVGQPLPERVPGSDIAPMLLEAANTTGGTRVFLLGAGPGVADRAARLIHETWPNVRVVGVYSPPFGFETNSAENEKIVAMINDAGADLLVVGLGAPKQELWTYRNRDRLRVPVTLCVGAVIDFLAGEKTRAPKWIQFFAMEWLHRMLSEPRRLTRRYARDAIVFPRLVFREWRRRHKRGGLYEVK
ncbi:MAG: WecB/TagA/CpsF family glycosyltransferase [Rhodospirillales bacterium]|nr:WecB/TagA/CpsF family glycosyltransferase [Rhodospirillales bacterium]